MKPISDLCLVDVLVLISENLQLKGGRDSLKAELAALRSSPCGSIASIGANYYVPMSTESHLSR